MWSKRELGAGLAAPLLPLWGMGCIITHNSSRALRLKKLPLESNTGAVCLKLWVLRNLKPLLMNEETRS